MHFFTFFLFSFKNVCIELVRVTKHVFSSICWITFCLDVFKQKDLFDNKCGEVFYWSKMQVKPKAYGNWRKGTSLVKRRFRYYNQILTLIFLMFPMFWCLGCVLVGIHPQLNLVYSNETFPIATSKSLRKYRKSTTKNLSQNSICCSFKCKSLFL